MPSGFKSRSKMETKKHNFTQAMNKCLCSNITEIDIKVKYSLRNFTTPTPPPPPELQITTHCRCNNCSQRTVGAIPELGRHSPSFPGQADWSPSFMHRTLFGRSLSRAPRDPGFLTKKRQLGWAATKCNKLFWSWHLNEALKGYFAEEHLSQQVLIPAGVGSWVTASLALLPYTLCQASCLPCPPQPGALLPPSPFLGLSPELSLHFQLLPSHTSLQTPSSPFLCSFTSLAPSHFHPLPFLIWNPPSVLAALAPSSVSKNKLPGHVRLGSLPCIH